MHTGPVKMKLAIFEAFRPSPEDSTATSSIVHALRRALAEAEEAKRLSRANVRP